jgi:hypothetical protein
MKPQDHYFDNEKVEELLTRYIEGACTDRALRDEIMEHAVPLIHAVIRTQNLAALMYPRGADTVEELASVAWERIEKILYKFEPGRAKVFSMWSQVTYLTCLAYIKKETRGACAVKQWDEGEREIPRRLRRESDTGEPKVDLYAEMADLRAACRGNDLYVQMVDYLIERYETEEYPWMGLSAALAERFGGRKVAKAFLTFVRGSVVPAPKKTPPGPSTDDTQPPTTNGDHTHA